MGVRIGWCGGGGGEGGGSCDLRSGNTFGMHGMEARSSID